MRTIGKNSLAFVVYLAICCLGLRLNVPLLLGSVLAHVVILVIAAILSPRKDWIKYAVSVLGIAVLSVCSLVGLFLIFGIQK